MASNVLTPIIGRATVGIELVADDGTREPLLFPDEISFEAATLVDTVDAWREWTIKLRATSRSVFERKITELLLTPRRRVAVKWGVDTGSGVTWAPLDMCRILRAPVEMRNNAAARSGLPFELSLVGELFDLDIKQRVVARDGTISQIIEEIAGDNGLESLVEPTGGAPVTLVQSYETDLQFIRKRLKTAAVNSAGVAGYYLYAQAGTLHFHTRDYRQQPWILPYNPAAADLVCVDDAQVRAQLGGAGVKLVTYDPLSGRTSVTESDANRYTRFGRRVSQADGGVLWAAHAGPNQASFEEGRAQVAYALSRDLYERVSFSGANMLGLKAGLILAVQLPVASDSANGYYHVDRVELTVSGGIASAAATASRGEVNGGRNAGSVQGVDSADGAVAAPFDAPGADPNFSPSSSTVLGSGPSVGVRPAG